MSEKTWVIGEFVETVQLQVVCQTLLNKLSGSATEITMEHLKAYGDVDTALQVFYEDSIRAAVAKTKEKGVNEGLLRTWFEKKLITPAETRGMAYRGETHTEGLVNDAVEVLDRVQHIIREERRGGGRWYELSHDRFIYPIKESNKNWLLQYSGPAKTRDWLETKATRWTATSGDEELLDQGQLLEGERWLASPEAVELGYDASVANLIKASRAYLKNQENQRRLELENAKREALSARRFRRLSYAMGLACIVAAIAVVLALFYARQAKAEKAKGKQLQIEGLRLKDLADSAQLEVAEKEKQVTIAEAKVRIADKKAQGLLKYAEGQQSQAHHAQARANSAIRQAKIEQAKANEARDMNTTSRQAFMLSRREETREQALEKFGQVIEFYRKIKDPAAEASTNLSIGEVYKELGEPDRAEEYFSKAAEVYRREKSDPLNEAQILSDIGLVYARSKQNATDEEKAESLKKGKEKLNRAKSIYRSHQDRLGEANTLVNLGDIELMLGAEEDPDTLTSFMAAGDLYDKLRENQDPDIKKKANQAIAAILTRFADHVELVLRGESTSADVSPDEIRPFYLQLAARIYADIPDEKGTANTFMKTAEGYKQLFAKENDKKKKEEYEKEVIDAYDEAVRIYQKLGDPIRQARAYLQLGKFYATSNDAGKNAKAADAFAKALSVFNNIGDNAGLISAYNVIGEFYGSESDHKDTATAIGAYSAAIKLYDTMQNTSGQADKYMEIGRLYHGDKKDVEADTAFQEVLKIYQEVKDSKSEADRLGEIGDLYTDQRYSSKASLNKALSSFQQAAAIYKTTESKDLELSMYDSAGEVCKSLAAMESGSEQIGFYRQAIEFFIKEADVHASSKERFNQTRRAIAFRDVGRLYRDKLQDKTNAVTFFNKALAIYQTWKSPSGISAMQKEILSVTEPDKPKQ